MDLSGLPYSVAPMRLEDVPTVSSIEKTIFSLPWSTAAFSYEIRHNPASQYFVLRHHAKELEPDTGASLPGRVRRLLQGSRIDACLLGYAGMWIAADEAHICTLAVRREWQGRGLGELLLVTLIERVMQLGSQLLTLEARISNVRAQNLYRKYGFKVVGRRKAYYSDNHEDALIMTTDTITSASYQTQFECLTARLRDRLLGQIGAARDDG